MRPRTVVALLVIVTAAATCVRLGFWQLSRFEYKKTLNAARVAALAAPPWAWDGSPAPSESLAGRRVRVRGRFDPTRHVLLAFRERDGAPGVELVTPLMLGDRRRVLVNRGWLSAEDAMRARPQDYPEPGIVEVVGVAETLGHGHFGVYVLEADSLTVLSARGLDLDTLASRLPGPLAPYLVRQLPGAGVPSRPRRSAPPLLDASSHLSYAAQWFLIAAVLLIGGIAFARVQTRCRPPAR